MRKKVLSLIILGILVACASPKKETAEVTLNTTPNVKAELVGKWIQPIPGQESEKQGIEFSDNGTAASINMYTLLYEQWKVSHDTLFLWYHTDGVREVSSDIDTFLIKKLDNKSLTLLPLVGNSNSNIVQNYNKEK